MRKVEREREKERGRGGRRAREKKLEIYKKERWKTDQQLSFLTWFMSETLVRATIMSSVSRTIFTTCKHRELSSQPASVKLSVHQFIFGSFALSKEELVTMFIVGTAGLLLQSNGSPFVN